MKFLFHSLFSLIYLFYPVLHHNQNLCHFKLNFINLYMNNLKDDIIPISMSLDDGYIYPTLVAITSIMENSNLMKKYLFYILHSPDFKNENQIKLKHLEKKYNGCIIFLINMSNNFQFINATVSKEITLPSYYRLTLPDLLPNVKKIIYLDGDTLSLTDLQELYDIDMNDYYYKGFLDISSDGVDEFTLENDHVICAGVLLINLEELRKDNMINKMYEFMIKNNKKLIQHDQTIINAVCYKKIGILPSKFGIFNLESVESLIHFSQNYRYKYKYSEIELIDAYLHPSVLHLVEKPWIKFKNCYKANLWFKYANKSGFYDEIIKKYTIHKNKWLKKMKFVLIIIFIFNTLFFLIKKRKLIFHKKDD